jgi:hypothetical protein
MALSIMVEAYFVINKIVYRFLDAKLIVMNC